MFLSDLSLEKKSTSFVTLLQTGRQDCFNLISFLKNLCGVPKKDLCGAKDSLWHVKPPWGRCRGMLVGINVLSFDIGEIQKGFFLSSLKSEMRLMHFNGFWFLTFCVWCSTRRKWGCFLTEFSQLLLPSPKKESL